MTCDETEKAEPTNSDANKWKLRLFNDINQGKRI